MTKTPRAFWPFVVLVISLEAHLCFIALGLLFEWLGFTTRAAGIATVFLPPLLHLRIPQELPLADRWKWPIGWIVITLLMLPYFFTVCAIDDVMRHISW